ILLTIYVGTYVPLVWAYIYLGRIPLVGGIWAITEAIPNFVAWVIYPLALFYVGVMLSRTLGGRPAGSRGRLTKVAALLLVGLIVFSNWQFFEGDFYPGQYSPVVPGNGISPMAALYPARMPGPVQAAYNSLSASLGNGSFSVYWPQAYGFTYNWSRRVTGWYNPGPTPPPQFSSRLSDIMLRNETWLTLPLMEAYGVRYLVVDNTSYTRISPLGPPITNRMEYEFLAESPGVELAYNFSPYVYVFEARDASSFQVASGSYSVEADPLEVESYFLSIFNSLPVLYNSSRPAAAPLSVDSALVNGSDLLTYSFLAGTQSAPPVPSTYFTYSPSQGVIHTVNNWYFESLRGSGAFNSTDGVISLSSNGNNVVSLSYGDFLSPGHTAIPIPQGCGVRLHVSFQFKGSPNDTVSSSVWVTDNRSFSSGQGGWYLGGVSEPGNGAYREVSYSTTIPPGMLYFEVQINPAFSGNLTIRDVNITYSFFRVAQGIQSQHYNLDVARPGNYTVGVLYFGNGTFTLGDRSFSLSSGTVSSFVFSASLRPGNLPMSYSGIHPIGVMLLDEGPGATLGADEGFNLLQASVSLRRAHGFLVISTPYAGWRLNNGSYLGLDALGRQVFLDGGATAISIEYGHVNNLVEIAFTVILYATLFHLFVVDRIRRILGRHSRATASPRRPHYPSPAVSSP
ncbi:MAG: hypothetical protein ACPL2E_07640, partial [Conexivisphaera sp.]